MIRLLLFLLIFPTYAFSQVYDVTVTSNGTLSKPSTLWSANAGAIKAVLSLATVATSGNYSDLSGLPTLGTAASTNATAYEVPLTFSTGLTRSTNTVTVNASVVDLLSTDQTITGNKIFTGTVSVGGNIIGGTTTFSPAAGNSFRIIPDTTSNCYLQTYSSNITTGQNLTLGTQHRDSLTILPTGFVGIGTLSPAAKLDVRGDSSISGNVIVTGTLTANGNVNLGDAAGDTLTIAAGTVQAANATSVGSANNIVNLGVQDARYYPLAPIYEPWSSDTTMICENKSTSGGVITEATGRYSLTAKASGAGNYAVSRFATVGITGGGTNNAIDWSKKVFCGVNIYHAGPDYQLGDSRVQWGTYASYLPTATPTTQCVGWRWKGRALYATMYSGSTYSEPGSSATFFSVTNNPQQAWLTIVGNGSGGFTWYANGTQIATTSSGPTSASDYSRGYVSFSSHTASSAAYDSTTTIISHTFGYMH